MEMSLAKSQKISFELLIFCTSIFLTLVSCEQNENPSETKTSDSATVNVIRADFSDILPQQQDIITDLSKSLSARQLSSLDSIWQNFYNISKKGIATIILD